MIYLLTQKNYPNCTKLKRFIEMGLGGRYDSHIEIVDREAHADLFQSLVESHPIQATPALVSGSDVLVDPALTEVEEFIKAHL